MKKYTTEDLRNPEMKLAIEYKGDLERLNKVFSEVLNRDTYLKGSSKYYTANVTFSNPRKGYTTVTESEILLMSEVESKPTKIKKGTVMQCITNEKYRVVFVGHNKKIEGHFKGVVLWAIKGNEFGSYYNKFMLSQFKPVQS